MQADWNGKNATRAEKKTHVLALNTYTFLAPILQSNAANPSRNNRLLHLNGSDPIVFIVDAKMRKITSNVRHDEREIYYFTYATLSFPRFEFKEFNRLLIFIKNCFCFVYKVEETENV